MKGERLTKADKEKILNFKKAGNKELKALKIAMTLTIMGIPLPYETYKNIEINNANEWNKLIHKIDKEWERRQEIGKHSGNNINTGVPDPDNSCSDVLHKQRVKQDQDSN